MLKYRESYVIVVGVDFSAASYHALDEALIEGSGRGGEVHVLHVEDDVFAEALLNRGLAAALNQNDVLVHLTAVVKQRMDEIAKRLRAPGLRCVLTHFRRGSPADQIAQLAADVDADLVLVGSHGRRGWQRLLLGSVAERTSRMARCPVWIVRPKDHESLGRVPQVEPPCPDCVAKRKATSGTVFWCARHSEPHVRPHAVVYFADPSYSEASTAYSSTPT